MAYNFKSPEEAIVFAIAAGYAKKLDREEITIGIKDMLAKTYHTEFVNLDDFFDYYHANSDVILQNLVAKYQDSRGINTSVSFTKEQLVKDIYDNLYLGDEELKAMFVGEKSKYQLTEQCFNQYLIYVTDNIDLLGQKYDSTDYAPSSRAV